MTQNWSRTLIVSLSLALCLAFILPQHTTRAQDDDAPSMLFDVISDECNALIDLYFPDLETLLTRTDINSTTFFFDSFALIRSTPVLQTTQWWPQDSPAFGNLLRYHIVSPGYYPTALLFSSGISVLPTNYTPASLGNRPQRLVFTRNATTGGLRVNGVASPRQFVVPNGVAHDIHDSVLIPPLMSIVGVLNNLTASTSTFLTLLNQAGLNSTIAADGGFTVFAPTNAAFNALQQNNPSTYQAIISSPAILLQVLNYHISQDLFYVGEPGSASTISTLAGSNITVSNTTGILMVANSSLISANNLARNGVVHLATSVLFPPGFQINLRTVLNGVNATVFVKQMDAANLSSLLNDTTSNHTVFAPQDSYFGNMSSSVNLSADLLSYHVVDNYLMLANLTDGMLLKSHLTLVSLGGNNQVLKVSIQNGTTYINNQAIRLPDRVATNGVVQILTGPLTLPPNATAVLRGDPTFSSLLSLLMTAVGTLPNATNTVSPTPTPPMNGTTTSPSPTNATNTMSPTPFMNGTTSVSPMPMNGTSPMVSRPPTTSGTVSPAPMNSTSAPMTSGSPSMNATTTVSPSPTPANSTRALVRSTSDNDAIDHVLRAVNDTAETIGDDVDRFFGVTLFAPSNSAIANLSAAVLSYLGSPRAASDLFNLIEYHLVPMQNGTILYSTNIPSGVSNYTTLDGESLSINKPSNASMGPIVLNGQARVTRADNLTAEGVIHTIDTFLFPPSWAWDLRKVLISLNCTTFLDLVTAANLTYLLTPNARNNYTLFAPTNAAFNNLTMMPSGDALRRIIMYHFVAGTYMRSNLSDGQLLTTILPADDQVDAQVVKVTVTGQQVRINTINTTSFDNTAVNGVVHTLSSVLVPPTSILQILKSTPQFSMFYSFVMSAGLNTILESGEYTVFVPTNEAMLYMNEYTRQFLVRPSALPYLFNVIAQHIIPQLVMVQQLPQGASTLTSYNNLTVSILRSSTNTFSLNNAAANITATNIIASNGVVHTINRVLNWTALYDFTLVRTLYQVGATRFVDALDQANMTSTFIVPNSSYTVFTPTNDAFPLVLPTGSGLVNLIKLHYVNGYHVTANMYDGELEITTLFQPTLNGYQRLKISDTSSYLGITAGGSQAEIIIPDQVVYNGKGAVHVIDRILTLPGNILSLLPSNSTLLSLINLSASNSLYNTNGITVLMPSENAFQSLSDGVLTYLQASNTQSLADLNDILSHFVLKQLLYSDNMTSVAQQYVSNLGDSVSLAEIHSDTGASIIKASTTGRPDSDATSTRIDLLASNGVAHELDQVLFPNNFYFTIEKVMTILSSGKFAYYMEKAGQSDFLDSTNDDPFTILIPTDAAFNTDVPDLDRLQRNELVKMMQNHVIQGSVILTPGMEDLESWNNRKLLISTRTVVMEVETR
eukprot:TRINITY_DN5110_c0_g2_i1.p1 TRINITY_DN5110_c0_g2~~TRINITY_DN5110_c0_g2_i1.p1  ORF type:complete len:1403 (-),score=195.94 TRINITY_DN5110_c0_g2_i1:108-4316(-)